MQPVLKTLIAAVEEAGHAVLNIQKQGFKTHFKLGNDPLTEADLLANRILHERLLAAYPESGWLSEETVDDLARLKARCTWIVDPIDGTREFVKNIPEYAISVALVENGLPILACVYNPASNELFSAEKGDGTYLNGKRVYASRNTSERLQILASRTEYEKGNWQRFKAQHDIKIVGSIAYKLALVAAGMADGTFSLGPKNEWDIAAGVFLIQEAQGYAVNKNFEDFVFNQKHTKVNGIVAATTESFKRLTQLIES